MSKRKILPAEESREIQRTMADAIVADRQLRQSVAAFLYEVFKADACMESSVSIVVNLIREFDAEMVVGWLRTSAARVNFSERKAMRYMCGIARNVRAEEEATHVET